MKPPLEQPSQVTWDEGRVPERLPQAIWRSPLIEVQPDRALLRLPTVGRFLAPVDGLPTVERRADVGRREVECFVRGPVRALQALLGGQFALRGSAVLVDGEALVIIGKSGVGKSALAAALMRSGSSVLADGYVFVDAGTPPTVQVSRTAVELWPDTVKALAMDIAGGEVVRSGVGKRAFAGPSPPAGGHVPVHRLVVLNVGGPQAGPSTALLRSIDLATALRTLASLGYLHQAVAALGASDNHFRWLTSLLSLRPMELCRRGEDIGQGLEALTRLVLEA